MSIYIYAHSYILMRIGYSEWNHTTTPELLSAPSETESLFMGSGAELIELRDVRDISSVPEERNNAELNFMVRDALQALMNDDLPRYVHTS